MEWYRRNEDGILLRIPYGKGMLPLLLPLRSEPRLLLPEDRSTIAVQKGLLESLERPLDIPPLREIVTRRKEATVVVDDDTRPPYARVLLPPLLDVLKKNGIRKAKIIFALGLHRPLDEERKRTLLGNLPPWVEVYNHNPYHHLSPLGEIGGRPVLLNGSFLSAPLKVVLGDVELHQIFGYGGGAKSLVPGIADAGTITWLHAFLTDPLAHPGVLSGNPVQVFLKEVYATVEVDVSVQVVLNMRGEILSIHTGSLKGTFLKGVDMVDGLYKVKVQAPFDVLIASAGGHPRDMDLYQTQKVINMTRPAIRKGGKLILFSQCSNGIGPAEFVHWLEEGLGKADVMRKVEEHFEMGLHKLYLFAKGTQDIEVYLYSSIRSEVVRRAFLRPLGAPEEVADLVQGERVGFVPFGTVTLLERDKR